MRKTYSYDHFTSTSINSFRFRYRGVSIPSDNIGLELLYGNPFITEKLLNLNFKISPLSFFQVNTTAAELLYSQIKSMIKLSPNSIVLDLCCGTGTIGQCLASSAKKVKKLTIKVLGIELCGDAVEDAKINAELNNLSNCVYIKDRVENVIDKLINRRNEYIDDNGILSELFR